MSLQKTYELATGPEPESFEAYADRLAAQFTTLLTQEPDEPEVQHFLERHPCLVPGVRSLGLLPSGFAENSMLISQPTLPGLRSRRPDFLWIAKTSVGIYPTLIEIERPDKRVFTAKGVPTAEFNQARHQLAQWAAWFAQPENGQKFIAEYGITAPPAGTLVLNPKFILIYGRRAEFESDPALSRERSFLLNDSNESLVSYDRLAPDPMLHNAITVRAVGDGRFRVIAVCPTFSLGPADATRLSLVQDLETALDGTDSIAPERRAFLLQRLPYWRTWAKTRNAGIIASCDRE